MSKVSEAHELTNHLHATFLGENNLITRKEIDISGVNLVRGVANHTQKLHVNGVINGKPHYQSLAKDKFGNFHLSTVSKGHGPGNPHTQIDIRPESPESSIYHIVESFFMQALIHIAIQRQKRPSN